MISPFKTLWDENPGLIDEIGKTFYMFGGGPVLGYARMYSFRSEDFYLSSVQNYNREYYKSPYFIS